MVKAKVLSGRVGRLPVGEIYPFAIIVAITVWASFLSGYWLHVFDNALLYIVLAVSINIVMGLAGLVSFGHSAFYACGGYAVGLLTVKAHWPFWATVPVAIAGAGVLGAVCGVISLRVGTHYLALVTLGAAASFQVVLSSWTSVTNGSDGLAGVVGMPLGPVTLASDTGYLWAFALLALLASALFLLIKRSSFGRRLQILAVDETLAAMAGVNTAKIRVVVFTISAALAGIAGALYAPWMGYIDPTMSSMDITVLVLIMLAVGGAGKGTGAVVGAIVVTLLQEWLRVLGDYQMAVNFAVVLLVLLLAPRGILDVRRKRSGFKRPVGEP